MSRHLEPATFTPGDRVTLDGSRGVVRLCKRKDGSTTMADGRPYLRVQITDGPRRGQWDWPDRWTHEEEDQDNTRPIEAPSERFMLSRCGRCQVYKWVFCLMGGPYAYLCGRCRRELREEQALEKVS